jgi:hypothetical protein
MIRVYKHDELVSEHEDTAEGRIAAARAVGKESGGLRFRGGEWSSGEWRVERDLGPTLVYRYGLLPPTKGADLVEAEFLGARKYRNQLVEIERERRDAVTKALSSHADTESLSANADRLVSELEQARLLIKSQNKRTRSKSALPAEKEAAKRIRQELKTARAKLKEAKAAIRDDPEVRAAIEATSSAASAKVKEARAARECAWGTGGAVEAAMDQAKDSKAPPEFVPWHRAKDRLRVQVIGGCEVGDVFGIEHTQIQIDPVDVLAWESPSRGERRRLSRTRVRMRVGSDGRSPIWAEWPMVMHRAIPRGARIMEAVITRRRDDCRRHRWELLLTLRMPIRVEQERRPGSVEVMTGCVRAGDRLVAAHWIGSDGRHASVELDPSVEGRLSKAEEIRSLRDELANDMREKLCAWLRGRDVPEWLAKESTHIHAWRAAARFRRLASDWRVQRFSGDEEGYALADGWRYRDEHLERYESGLRRGARGHRKEQYRTLAAQLAEEYGELVLTTMDKRDERKNPLPESDRPKMTKLKRAQSIVSVSTLEDCLRHAFPSHGGSVIERSDADETPATARASNDGDIRVDGGSVVHSTVQ